MNKPILLFAIVFVLLACQQTQEIKTVAQTKTTNDSRIAVLNFGTFHFGYTTDGSSVEFDQHSDTNRLRAQAIAKELAAFKPTVLIVETLPAKDSMLLERYKAHLRTPGTIYEHPWELQLLAFELGRFAGTVTSSQSDFQRLYWYSLSTRMRHLPSRRITTTPPPIGAPI